MMVEMMVKVSSANGSIDWEHLINLCCAADTLRPDSKPVECAVSVSVSKCCCKLG